MTTKKTNQNSNLEKFDINKYDSTPRNSDVYSNDIVTNYLKHLETQNQNQNIDNANSQLTKPSQPIKPAEKRTEPHSIFERRISQKQRKASLEEYKNSFLNPPKITDRKTVYLSKDTRDRLDEIVRRLGERGSNVSGFIENMAKEHLELYREEIDLWKRL